MYFKTIFIAFLICFKSLTVISCHELEKTLEEDSISILASLTFAIGERLDISGQRQEDKIEFSDAEIEFLWDKAFKNIHFLKPRNQTYFKKAYEHYIQSNQSHYGAYNHLKDSFHYLNFLWENSVEENYGVSLPTFPESIIKERIQNQDFEQHSKIPYKVKMAMRPHVISDHHAMKKRLDALFSKVRVTQDETTFLNHGFIVISVRPCTYVYVAAHPQLPGHLVKAYLDTEQREKQHRPSWKWLIKRCEGAKAIAQVIRKKKIKHFTVANKWIYPLPEHSFPSKNHIEKPHYALLLVTDMELVPYEMNLQAWNQMTEEHLNELYIIISRAKGSSYRPDNIAYTKHRQFAFIDTEYPSQGPDYRSLRRYLSPAMLIYWDRLVKKGGK